MSLIGNLLRISAEELESYKENSLLLQERVYPGKYAEDPARFDLDKTWEGIYYLLTGCAAENYEEALPPFSKILFGGTVLDENQDLGQGPASYCTPEEVAAISAALPELNMEEVRRRFDDLESTGHKLYPDNPNDEMLQYILQYYVPMKQYYEIAAKNKEAVISFIN